MTMNVKTFINYDRQVKDCNGRSIDIYRKQEFYLTKEEVLEVRKNKEQMNLNVSSK